MVAVQDDVSHKKQNRNCMQQLEGIWLAALRYVPSLTIWNLLCSALSSVPAGGKTFGVHFSDPTVLFKAVFVEAMKLKIPSHHVSLTQL
eukprot:s2743_g4.t1